jgi:hypothetical protein
MSALTQNLEMVTGALMPDLIWDEVTDEGNDPLLSALPFGYVDADKIKYDQFEDPYGLIPMRGIDHAPEVVQMPGYRTYQIDPGYFGLATQLRESEVTSERQPGTLADPLDVSDRLGKLMMDGAAMVTSRFRKSIGDLLSTGTLTITGTAGQVFQYAADGYRTLSPGTGWQAAPTTATPITDLLGWQATLQKGSSSRFGADSVLLCNSNVIVDLFKTTQVQSTYKATYGSSIIGLDGKGDLKGLNEILQGFDLPKIVRYDKGYFPTLADAKARTTANWVYAVANKSLVWIGTRPKGQQLGQFQLTRHAGLVETAGANRYPTLNVENESVAEIAKGIYVRAHYHNRMPHHYDLEIGFNGCPVLWYGSAAAGISYT